MPENNRLLLTLIRCPQCRVGKLSIKNKSQELFCEVCATYYPIICGRPVLLRHDNELFRIDVYKRPPLIVSRNAGLCSRRFVPKPSVNLARETTLGKINKILSRLQEPTVLVVGCGTQRNILDKVLKSRLDIRIVYIDIDANADVNIFCDVHELPFNDDVFDVVIATAVLEHVLYPEKAVTEIHRVLKVGGLIYSEMPFIQQVHEGAYDFTRLTLSGHRRMFNRFSNIQSGMVAGPATALVWAIEYFFLAFTRWPFLRSLAKAIIRITFSWIKYLDYYFINRPEAMDGASCTYFLGRKVLERISDSKIIAEFVGSGQIKKCIKNDGREPS